MKNMLAFETARKYGRITGVFYLIIIFCGLISEFYIRSGLVVQDDAVTTIQNIQENERLFRLGIMSDLIMVISDVVVGVVFYFILRHAHAVLALLAAFFRLAQASIIALNLNNLVKVVLLLGGSTSSDISADVLQTHVLLNIDAHTYGYIISSFLFAMSCLLLGYLFIKSVYFPKFLGILILVASVGYVFDVVVNIVMPEYAHISEVILVISAIFAELTLCVWLLVKGVKKQVPAE